MWQRLKKNLSDPLLSVKASNLLNTARYFGSFGSGAGGQISEYVFSKILSLDLTPEQSKTNFYLQCGKWWSKYSKMFPDVPEQSDIVYIKTKQPVDELLVNDHLVFKDVQNIQTVSGVSIKTSHKSNNSQKTITAQCKVYSADASYSKKTFGVLFDWFNQNIQNHVEPRYHDQRLFPQGWRDPKFSTYHQVLIQGIKDQLSQRLKTDPIKVQFAKDKVLIFRIPITQIYKSISVRTLLPNPKFHVSQGRFSITTPDSKRLLTVMGDRIMICQGFDKSMMQTIQIDLPPYNVKGFMTAFSQFVQLRR